MDEYNNINTKVHSTIQGVIDIDFCEYFMYFFDSNPGVPGVGLLCILGTSVEQIWERMTRQCHMSNLSIWAKRL